jgi:hypothetical protein
MLGAALIYAERGFRVHPLYQPIITDGTVRCSCSLGAACPPKQMGKHPRCVDWPDKATTDGGQMRRWWRQWPQASIGIVPGAGSGIAVLDTDPRNGGDVSLEELQRLYHPLPDTPLVLTGGGGEHRYFALEDDLPILKLAPGIDFLADGHCYAIAPPSLHASGRRYTWEVSQDLEDTPLAPLPDWLVALVHDKAREYTRAAAELPDDLPSVDVDTLKVRDRMKRVITLGDDQEHPYPSRSEAVYAVMQAMIRAGYDDAHIAAVLLDERYRISERQLEKKNPRSPNYWILTKGYVAGEIGRARAKHQGDLGTRRGRSRARSRGTGETHSAGAWHAEAQAAGSETADRDWEPPLPEPRPWPEIENAAYYGLAGEIVQAIAPHTEGDPVAILVQFLAMFGSCLGRSAYFPVGADSHYANIFVCLVGKSSRGRKGTAAGYPRRLLSAIDPPWGTRLLGGVSSGEGIIWQVRDPIGEEGDKRYDPGAADKRLCILETEFARALAKMSQEGNVLSAILRQAWDHGTLRALTSGRVHSPVQATDAHISVITHITEAELQRLLAESEAANGFGNRFLWVCVKRSKLLPHGGEYPEALQPLSHRVRQALTQARTTARMHRSPEAARLWESYYAHLSEERPGLLGEITARAEAQVLRLSCLYALLDATSTITPEHLDAAVAVWRYCEASAAYIFGDMLGNPLADELLRMIRMAGSSGITRTEMSNNLGRNVKSAVIGHALALLLREHLAYARQTRAEEQRRPTETWYSYEFNEFNEFNASASASASASE